MNQYKKASLICLLQYIFIIPAIRILMVVPKDTFPFWRKLTLLVISIYLITKVTFAFIKFLNDILDFHKINDLLKVMIAFEVIVYSTILLEYPPESNKMIFTMFLFFSMLKVLVGINLIGLDEDLKGSKLLGFALVIEGILYVNYTVLSGLFAIAIYYLLFRMFNNIAKLEAETH